MFPLCQFIAPRRLKLRPAQTVGIFGRKYLRHSAAVPDQPFAAWFETRPVMARNRCDPGRPFDHHLAHIGQSLTDQGDGRVRTAGEGRKPAHEAVYPLSTQPGLARTTTSNHQPGRRLRPKRILPYAGEMKPLLSDQPRQPAGHIRLRPAPVHSLEQARRCVGRSLQARPPFLHLCSSGSPWLRPLPASVR